MTCIRPSIRTAPIIATVLMIAAVACSSVKPLGQNPSPMVEQTRAHERVKRQELPGFSFAIDGLTPGKVEVYVPPSVESETPFDILVHFHGAAFISHTAAFRSSTPLVAVNVHLGAGSSANERAFQDESVFPGLLTQVRDELAKRGLQNFEPRGLYLSAFSAGYGAIRAILPFHHGRIDGVLLLDGLHTDYVPERLVLHEGGSLNTEKLDPFLDYARLATRGEKRLLITHSDIFPGTFASTTETTDYLIETLGLRRTPVLEWGPGGMQLLSCTSRDGLVILGFAGNTAPDHVDHFHGLSAFSQQLIALGSDTYTCTPRTPHE